MSAAAPSSSSRSDALLCAPQGPSARAADKPPASLPVAAVRTRARGLLRAAAPAALAPLRLGVLPPLLGRAGERAGAPRRASAPPLP